MLQAGSPGPSRPSGGRVAPVSEPADDDGSPAPDSAAATADGLPPSARRVTFRRAPRYRAFILTGVLIAVAIATVLTLVFPDNGQFSAGALFGYLAVILALILGVAGALVAIFVERPRGR